VVWRVAIWSIVRAVGEEVAEKSIPAEYEVHGSLFHDIFYFGGGDESSNADEAPCSDS
jgi:hypothetical protein